MSDVKKKITIRNEDQSGMPEMISSIYGADVEALKEILIHLRFLMTKGWEIYEEAKKEYKRAERPRVFWGLARQKDVMMKAERYAQRSMGRFFGTFNVFENNLVTSMIRLNRESPAEFLSAIKSVMSGENGRTITSGKKDMSNKTLEELLYLLKLNGGNLDENARTFRKTKRGNITEITED